MNAVSKGDMKALEKLIKDDTDLNKEYDNITPINLAAARNDKEMVKFLEKGADINLEDGYGYTPLMKAIDYYNVGLAKNIIDLKPDLNAVCSATGDTPLTYLVNANKYGGGADLCYYMIKNGADINKKNKEGNTPLMIAAASYNYGIVGVLANMGADYNIKNKEGKTAIDIASARDDKSALHHMTNPIDLEHYLSY